MNYVLKYPGAKWDVASWVISFFPPHSPGFVGAPVGIAGAPRESN